ncbi:MAG: DegT/DnrJ/EryC1/StrS aminotransferase family protein [Nitrococcus mobilis]|nr:DegT/DnrJ/EryC1/StrS aminotransferase family protein [Nitrococcus mobilis]
MNPWPHYDSDEIAAVQRVLASGRVNYWNGEEGRNFEREFAAAMDCEHAVVLANGTVALDLALRVLGLSAGDEVVVTPRTFMASASCIVNAGAAPLFADVDPDSQNITAETIEQVLTPRTRAIMCVHLAGWPCEMAPIMALAEARGLKVIEDCAQAHGARYEGRSVGSFGHAAGWSFCTDKIMTTGGEGGMLTTNDLALWKSAWEYKDHGKSWDAVYKQEHPPGFRWLHESFGTNWRMTEMQAAIGRIQLTKLDAWVTRRRAHAARLNDVCRAFPAVRLTEPPAHVAHAYYKYYCFVRPERLRSGWSRDRIVAELQARGVPAMQGSCPEVYREKAFEGTGYRPAERLPVARELDETSLMLPVHPTLSESDLERFCAGLGEVLEKASL